MEELIRGALPEALGALIASAIIGFVAWMWKDKKPWIKPLAIVVIVAILSLSAGYLLGSKSGGIFTTSASINDMKFTAFGWTYTEVESERGHTDFSITNDDLGNKKYRLNYSLPLTNTQTSWVGLGFTFTESQDLRGYNFVRLDIEFDSPEVICSFDMRDISNRTNSVLVGLNRTYGKDIAVSEVGNNQIITIPLNPYYIGIENKAILDLGCGVSTEISRGEHKFTINNIEFLK